MKSRTATFVIVGLLILIAVLWVLGGVSQAADLSETDTVTVLPMTITFQAEEVPSRSGAHCWEFTADQQLKNLAGRIQAWPALEAMWCTGRQYQKVTDLVYLHCFSKGGFYSYDGCKKDAGKTGYSYLGAQGHWHYHWIINGIVFDKTPDLTIRYYANGAVTGTWYWHTT